MIRAQKLKRSLFALGTWFGAGTFHCQKGPQRYSPFRRWQIQHDHALVEQEGKISTGLFCIKRGRISLTKIPEKKMLQALWFVLTFTSLYKVHVQCLFVQESHPWLFSTSNSPIMMAKTPRSCLFLSEPWCAAGSFLCLKGIPIEYSVDEGSDLTWEVLLCNIGNISAELDKMARAKWTFHKLQRQEFGSAMGAEDIQLNEQTPAPMLLSSGMPPLPIS